MSIPVTDIISTTAPSDTYATHDASLGKGGHRTVETFSDMLAISPERRVGGMQVHVRETDKLYKLSASQSQWNTFTESLVLFSTLTDIAGDPNIQVGQYVFFNDTQTVHIIEENLQASAPISGAVPAQELTVVPNQTALNAIAKADRYLGMLTYVTDDNKYYKLVGFMYNSQGQFTPSILDWQEIAYVPEVYVLSDLAALVALPTDQVWASRKIVLINETMFLQLNRFGNEWEEIPKSDAPYYIVSTLINLATVPPFYRQPGVLVYVVSETKLYTRDANNTEWILVTSDATPGTDGRGIVDAIVNPVTGQLEIEYTDGVIDAVGVVVGAEGEPGVSVVNIDLFEDPLVPGAVYFNSTLSNGTNIRTTTSLAGYSGKSVVDVYLNNNNELIFTLSDASVLPAVPVSGIVSIQSVNIVGDDIVITYTNGTTSVAGAAAGLAGRSVTDAYVTDGELFFEYDKNPGPDVPVKVGDVPGIAKTYLHKSNICVSYTNQGTKTGNGTPGDVVAVLDVNGKEIAEITIDGTGTWEVPDAVVVGELDRIVDVKLNDGTLYANYSSDPAADVSLGNVISVVNAVINAAGELVFQTSKAGVEYNVGELSSITDAYAAPNRDLVFITSIPDTNTGSGFKEINIGPVDNLRGQSLSSVALNGNNLIFTLENGTELAPIPVSGLTPISIVGAEIVNGDLVLELTDGSFINAGIAEDLKPREITTFVLNGDELTVNFDDGSSEVIPDIKYINSTQIVNGQLEITYTTGEVSIVGDVPGIADIQLVDGTLSYSLTTDPLSFIQIGILKSLADAEITNGQLIFFYEDAPTVPVVIGNVPGISAARVTTGRLFVDYTDGRTNVDLGNVTGPQGARGWSITNASVDAGGNLIVATDNPSSPTINAGFVRTTIQNFIGQTADYSATAGQTEFMVSHNEELLVFVNGDLLSPSEYNTTLNDRITLNTPLAVNDEVRIVTYAAGGPSATGRGVFTVNENSGVFTITLEDGTPFIIDTNTPVDVTQLPAGIDTITVLPNGDIQVFLTDGTNFIAGSANNAVSIVGAEVNEDGDLIIETDDPANQFINAGSVLSGLTITGATIDLNGDLIFTTSTGSFNAGPAANYVTGATINPVTGNLSLQMSAGNILDAGTVRNPLLGMVYDFVCFDGQVDFPLEHNGYEVVVYANGVALSKSDIILTNPAIVTLADARVSNDIVKIMLMSSGSVIADEVQGAASAASGTYYGKDDSGTLGFHPTQNIRSAAPNDFVALPAQTLFFVTHKNQIEVIVNGVYYMPNQYTLPNTERVLLNSPLSGGEQVRINVLSSPSGTTGLLNSDYAHFRLLSSDPGGTALRGTWMSRNLSELKTSTIAGASISRSNPILPAGTYYVRGWAASNGVGANAIRLYNTTTQQVMLIGESVFGGSYNTTTVSKLPTLPNCHAPIEGYITLPMQSALQLQHRVVRDVTTYGLGVTGGGVFEGSGFSSTQPNTGSNTPQSALGIPATLVSLEVWKVG